MSVLVEGERFEEGTKAPSLCPFLKPKHLGNLLEYTDHNESP
jgi:hypothetical protein